MKVLWVTPKWTLPAIDGARVASLKLLKNLDKKNIELHYLAFSNNEDVCNEDELKKFFSLDKVYNIPREVPFSKSSK